MVIVFMVILLLDFNVYCTCAEREFCPFFANNHNHLQGEEKRISKRQILMIFEQKMAPKHFLEYFQ